MYKNINSKTLLLHLEDGVSRIDDGPLVTSTEPNFGRSPNAKRYVNISDRINIDFNNNKEISKEEFVEFLEKFQNFAKENNENIYLQEVFAVRDPRRQMKVDIYTEFASHSLFSRNMFVPLDENLCKKQEFDTYTVYHFPTLLSEPTVLISMQERIILISGTLYSGEIKKSVFSVLNYHFPTRGWLPMHCSVNLDKDRKNPAIFFGLSGTGKTTLSSDKNRVLIGDDEHGWTDVGLTNFENGCYAKTINLSKDDEPQIWKASHGEFSILENVIVKDGSVDFSDGSKTENTRSSYPASYIEGADKTGYVDLHPNNIIMLTCDAFGVLPAVMRLDRDEAVEQFLLGYTAKVAGTEEGVKEPVATFSFCFGAPFMPLRPMIYADILRDKIKKHNVSCWLVNTGWSGGPYGVGSRMPIKVTRSIIDKIHDKSLGLCEFEKHEYTGFSIPKCDEINEIYLKPEKSWGNLSNYKDKCSELLHMLSIDKDKYRRPFV
jgi:phosphoenolpyruvate carboxykinase (ATP)